MSFIVTEAYSGQRLDKLLSIYFPTYSRTYFQYLIDEGAVLLNGKQVKKREIPVIGDEIEVCFLLTPEISLEPENIPLEILYEDEWILAINKGAGMVVHPGPGHPSHTFVNALLFHCHQLEKHDPLRPGIVHRLDKDTSGVLLAAKTKEAHQQLVSLFSNRQVKKKYLAICVGNPGNVTIKGRIGRDPTQRQEMSVVPKNGKEAITHIQVLAYNENLSLVLALPETGRTHQIRVHLKSQGTPVLGDEVYGSENANRSFHAKRQLLHAYHLSFLHPFKNIFIDIMAPPPSDFNRFIHLLKAEI